MIWSLTALSLLGVVLNIHKRRACFVVWAVTNAAWCVVSLSRGLPERAALDAVYFGLALWGLWKWRRA